MDLLDLIICGVIRTAESYLIKMKCVILLRQTVWPIHPNPFISRRFQVYLKLKNLSKG